MARPTDNNYGYDRIGNLVRDTREGIYRIHWTTSGKVREVVRVDGNSAPRLLFAYDAAGHRLVKRVELTDGSRRAEYYIRDTQGNVPALSNTEGVIRRKHSVRRVEGMATY